MPRRSSFTRPTIRTGISTCRARSGTCRSCPRRPSTTFSAAPRRACLGCLRATTGSATISKGSAISWRDARARQPHDLLPSPLSGGVGVVRREDAVPDRTTPHPNPPPQGGRERNRGARGFAFAVAILLAGPTTSHAQDSQDSQESVAAFYQGRQINLIVGYGPGGGYDLTARLVARHIGRFIPGHPSVAVQNMAGAGSLRAANWLYGAAPKDGATFGVFGSDIPLVGLVGANASAQFDPRQFTWLGSSSSFANDAFVLIVRADATSPSITAARRAGGPPIVLGGHRRGRTRCRRAEDPARRARPQHPPGARISGLALALSRGRARRDRRPHVRFFRGQVDAPGLARPGQRLQRPPPVRAHDAPSRAARSSHGARARTRRECARPDRVRRDAALDHGAAVRGPARCAG